MSRLPISSELNKIAKAITKIKGRVILVGGAVRDHFLDQRISNDLDLEIYGLSMPDLEVVLKEFGKISAAGKSFGVLKLKTPTAEYDFSLPRRERKTGKGHRCFKITTDPLMSFKEASARRDFTVNSMGYDIIENILLDPFEGIKDIKNKKLRHVGPAFAEDPLRVYRAMQFSARLEFKISAQTEKFCRKLDLSELPRERIFEEFCKLLLKAKKPSIGLKAAKQIGVLKYFPEIKALEGVPQDPKWHPEGDVWTHTLMVLDEAARLRTGIKKKDLVLMFGALCHDFGKPSTTKFLRGRWRSPSHDKYGIDPTLKFMQKLTDDRNLIKRVTSMVKEHLRPIQLFNERERINSGTIRRLALRVSISDLILLAKADYFGRNLTQREGACFQAGEWLLKEAKKMNVKDEGPRPLLMGKHLLKLGLSPGPEMGKILKLAFEKQLNGDLETNEQALSWAKSNYT